MPRSKHKKGAANLPLLAAIPAAMLVLSTSMAAMANDYGESRAWQFETSADKANKAVLEDMRLRKKGGYYDSFQNIYNTTNTTNIERQVNCNVAATATGNNGNNAMDGSASSPNVNNDGGISSTSTGNTSDNSSSGSDPSGVVLDSDGSPSGGVDNNQDNSGTQDSDVTDSTVDIATGPINADGGTNNQAINSDQDNGGSQYASITDSTACSLASAGPLN